MKYKNASESHLDVPNFKMLEPGEEIDLTQEEEKDRYIVKAKNWGWLIPIVEDVVDAFIQSEINTPNNTTTLVNVDVKEPVNQVEIDEKGKIFLRPPKQLPEKDKQRIIEEAINRAKKGKKAWNPMDDAAPEGEPDFLGTLNYVNTKNEYGNVEHQYVNNNLDELRGL